MTLSLAQDLKEAQRFLDVSPLRFLPSDEEPREAEDGRRYVPPPGPPRTGGKRPFTVMEQVRDRLLAVRSDTKLFLSGHTGSGKSTELARLIADEKIRERFHVIHFRFEEEEWAYLDSTQVLFRIAAELFLTGQRNDALKSEGRWKKLLEEVQAQLGGPSGAKASEVPLSVEWDLFFVKLRQELKLSPGRRAAFRKFGETQQTLLPDLVAALAEDLESGLVKQGDIRQLLLVVDDLDKVREKGNLEEIFDRNVNALLQPPFRMLATLPSSVFASVGWSRLRDATYHLRPVQVMKETVATDPQQSMDASALGFFRDVLAKRLKPGLVAEDAMAQAVLYSGGVTRDFFHLLREAAFWAVRDELDQITAELMDEIVHDVRIKWSYGIFPPDRRALSEVHSTHQLPSQEHTTFLDRSWVLEFHNGHLWYEVNPLLWNLLEE